MSARQKRAPNERAERDGGGAGLDRMQSRPIDLPVGPRPPRKSRQQRALARTRSLKIASSGAAFDAGYYARFYGKRGTRVSGLADTRKLVAFVGSYLDYLGIPVRRVLDAGCGLGRWQIALAERYPAVRYAGIEVSSYLCERFGWEQASIAEYRGRGRYDLVVCQGVLQYLTDAQAARALDNLGRLCRGALYLEALTTEDWAQACDRRATDGAVHRRPVAFYRKRLSKSFIAAGGGVFVHRDASAVLYALEKSD